MPRSPERTYRISALDTTRPLTSALGAVLGKGPTGLDRQLMVKGIVDTGATAGKAIAAVLTSALVTIDLASMPLYGA